MKFPATFVPRAPAAVHTIPGTNRPWPLDKRGQPWPRSRFGQPLRPLDEYPPGVRAPGEGYTGPIADPDEAMRAALASEDVLAQAAQYAADPDAPIRAYLSAMAVWKNPGRYAGAPRPKAPVVTAVEPASKPLSNPPPSPKAAQASPGPEVVQVAAPLAAALGAAVLGGVAGALLGGAPGTPSAPPGAKRPRTGGRGTMPPLPPLPGFSQAPPPGAVEGYDAHSVGPLKLPTPATPAEPQVEHGPAVDVEKGPRVMTMAPPWPGAEKVFSTQKQDGHIAGTPHHKQRLQANKPTSTFDVNREEAYKLVQEAWAKGTPVPNRPGLRDYDFGRRVGTAPDGRGQTKIRVHQDADGRIHGHPVGS